MSIATPQPGAKQPAHGGPPTARALSVAQIAARFGVKVHLVLTWIHCGDLAAIDVRGKVTASQRPRWKVLPADLEVFEQRRRAKPAAAPQPRRKQKATIPATEPVGRRW